MSKCKRAKQSGLTAFPPLGSPAAYREAASRMSDGVSNGIITALNNRLGDDPKANEKIAKATEVLATPFGKRIVAMILAKSIDQIPGLQNDPRVDKLAKHFLHLARVGE
jgi:hypothetical protein